MHAGQASAEDGEVLREDVDRTSIDQARAGDDGIAVVFLFLHAEIGAAMFIYYVQKLPWVSWQWEMFGLVERLKTHGI